MGTFPAGVQGKTVFAAGLFPLTGAYASLGNDEKKGFELAIEHLNNGSQVTEAVPSLKKGGGVLGKKVDIRHRRQPNPGQPRGSGRHAVHRRQQCDGHDRRHQQRDRRRP